MDLKGHQLECHPNGLSKDARRDARTVDLSAFDYRTPYQPQRQRRGAGRGRDPNAETLPTSSAQPLRRDEIAYQRQMAVQSAQSVSTRSFGGQLTRNDTQTVQAPPRSGNATPARSPPAQSSPVPELQNLSLMVDSATATPQERARNLRHTAVIERASNLLRNDQAKLGEFRTKVSNYRTSTILATELIDAFFSLFDTSSAELGKLIKELADIYEDESKRTSLLQAWNDWRAINEDYPALPGPGGLLPGMSPSTVNGSGAGGNRVLRLKSSTAQSSRSAVGRTGALPSSASSRTHSHLCLHLLHPLLDQATETLPPQPGAQLQPQLHLAVPPLVQVPPALPLPHKLPGQTMPMHFPHSQQPRNQMSSWLVLPVEPSDGAMAVPLGMPGASRGREHLHLWMMISGKPVEEVVGRKVRGRKGSRHYSILDKSSLVHLYLQIRANSSKVDITGYK